MKYPKRIYIIGTSGSGKTTVAKILSKKFKIPAYDLDDLFFARKFDIRRNEKERAKLLTKIAKKPKWIIEGVYHKWIEDAIKKSDLVIWLDISQWILIRRVISRFLKRSGKHKEKWSDLWELIKFIRRYRHRGYYKHREIIKKHKLKFVYIQNNSELNEFMKDIFD